MQKIHMALWCGFSPLPGFQGLGLDHQTYPLSHLIGFLFKIKRRNTAKPKQNKHNPNNNNKPVVLSVCLSVGVHSCTCLWTCVELSLCFLRQDLL